MIVVRAELWPRGDEASKRSLGECRIANVGGTRHVGKYRVELVKWNNGQVWKKGWIEGFPRVRLGPWDLLYRCLREVVGSRNEEDSVGESEWKARALEAEAKLEALRRAYSLVARSKNPGPEPIACWKPGCYLAVDAIGRCELHGGNQNE